MATKPPSRLTESPWAKRRDIPIAILSWTVLILLLVWILHYISQTILLLLFSVLLAYAFVPVVRLLERFLPRVFAVIISYLIMLTGLGILIYFVTSTAVIQFVHLTKYVNLLLGTNANHQNALILTIKRFGISDQQIHLLSQQITQQAEYLTSSIVPFLSSIFSFIVDLLVVAVLSIYLLLDGQEIERWIHENMPYRQQKYLTFGTHTLERILGGYIRGQVLMAIIMGILVGVGMTLFHVPYAVFLGVITFLLEFIPIIGTLISGAVCVLLAFTQGWLIALFVLIYFIVMHVIEGDILGPRIVGQAVGLHPIISIIALIAGTELFGIVGALFAAPVTGILQVLLTTLLAEWKKLHPEEFKI